MHRHLRACCVPGLLITWAVTWGMKDSSDCEEFNKDYAKDVHDWCVALLIIYIISCLTGPGTGQAATQQ